MGYTRKEKEMLSLLEKTDFRNLSEKDFLAYMTNLNKLRPDVAAQLLAQYPEMAQRIISMASDYKLILDKVIDSDDKSLEQFCHTVEEENEVHTKRRLEFFWFANKVREDLKKGLDDQSLTEEQRDAVREQEIELLRMLDKKDSEIANDEKENVHIVDKKDSEKREFNWKIIRTASTIAVLALSVGAAALGVKLPNSKKR